MEVVHKSSLFLLICISFLGLGFKHTASVSGLHIRHQHHHYRQQESSSNSNSSSSNHSDRDHLSHNNNLYQQNISTHRDADERSTGSSVTSEYLATKIRPSPPEPVPESSLGLERGQVRVLNLPESKPNLSPVDLPKKSVPAFLSIFHNLLVNSNYADADPGERKEPFQTLTRAWFPSSLTYGEMGSFVVSFVTNSTHRHQLERFMGAQLIFTLQNSTGTRRTDEDDSTAATLTFVSSSRRNEENKTISSLPVEIPNKFCIFDVTDEIRPISNSSSRQSGSDLEEINFTFHIRKKGRLFRFGSHHHDSFSDYFDAGADKPFILIRYQNVPLIIVSSAVYDDSRFQLKQTDSHRIGAQRQKRSAGLRNDSNAKDSLLVNSPKPFKYLTDDGKAHINEILNETDREIKSSKATPRNYTGSAPDSMVRGRGSERPDQDITLNETEESNSSSLLNDDVADRNRSENISIVIKSTVEPATVRLSTNSGVAKVSHRNGVATKLSKTFPPSGGNGLCQRQKWLTKPTDIGWNNIYSPSLLDLGFCAGDCPYPLVNERFNFTTHSFLLDRLRLLKPFVELPKKFPSPCCVPVSYETLMIMEDDGHGGIATILYNDISVSSCGCR